MRFAVICRSPRDTPRFPGVAGCGWVVASGVHAYPGSQELDYIIDIRFQGLVNVRVPITLGWNLGLRLQARRA